RLRCCRVRRLPQCSQPSKSTRPIHEEMSQRPGPAPGSTCRSTSATHPLTTVAASVPSTPGVSRVGERGTQSSQLLLGPHGLQHETTRLVPVDDRPPRVGGRVEPPFALEQEGAAVKGADVLRPEVKREPPISQRTLRLAQTCSLPGPT